MCSAANIGRGLSSDGSGPVILIYVVVALTILKLPNCVREKQKIFQVDCKCARAFVKTNLRFNCECTISTVEV